MLIGSLIPVRISPIPKIQGVSKEVEVERFGGAGVRGRAYIFWKKILLKAEYKLQTQRGRVKVVNNYQVWQSEPDRR